MEEQELTRKIQLLYAVKPREDWVILTRQRLVGPNQVSHIPGLQKGGFWAIVTGIGRMAAAYSKRPAFVFPTLVFLAIGSGAAAQGVSSSLPGDALYPLREAVEQLPSRLSSKEKQPIHQFALVQQRLADLKAVAEQNKVKNLPSAIEEFEENASKVTQGFLQIVENEPERALQASRQMVELQKEKLKVEQILGTKIGEEQEEDIENAVKKIVEYELAYLETRSLVAEQEVLLENARKSQEEGNYEEALETIWQLSQNE